jgi:N-glycosylase/DNA lyase
LQRFPGVGRKVAACVMLFAYQRMEAFPVDVWIERVLREHYPEGFPAYRFKGMAGILQQYLFCYARHLAGRD